VAKKSGANPKCGAPPDDGPAGVPWRGKKKTWSASTNWRVDSIVSADEVIMSEGGSPPYGVGISAIKPMLSMYKCRRHEPTAVMISKKND
jgi:hypothetical protein